MAGGAIPPRTTQDRTTRSTRCVSTPRMGQQHPSPGQSVATERREAPPWVTEKRQINALKGPYKIGASIMVCNKNRWFGPFRATGVFVCAFPGRRCSLPWAKMFKPVGLRIAIAHGPCIPYTDDRTGSAMATRDRPTHSDNLSRTMLNW